MSPHIKMTVAPKSWPLPRTGRHWIMNPSPGPHSKELGMPLLVLIRDVLKLADTAREARYILKEGKVLVDGKVRKSPKFPVGPFDLIEIPLIKARFRVLLDTHKRLMLVAEEREEQVKLYRVIGKSIIKGGRIQLHLHDGVNILTDDETIKPGGSLLLSLPDKHIIEYVPLREGVLCYITGGKHVGELATLKELWVTRVPMRNMAVLERDGETFETVVDYVVPVGRKEALISIPQTNMDNMEKKSGSTTEEPDEGAVEPEPSSNDSNTDVKVSK